MTSKGTLVKLSEHGLDWLFPVHGHLRNTAAKKRYLYCNPVKNNPEIVRVKRQTSDSYIYYHKSFIEDA